MDICNRKGVDVALDNMRSAMLDLGKANNHTEVFMILLTIAEYAQDIDEWMSKGGFAPADWNRS